MTPRQTAWLGALLLAIGCGACSGFPALVAMGEERELRSDPPAASRPPDAPRASILVIALDGVRRDLLYELLRDGELPGLATLIGGREGREFPHAWLAEDLVTTLPSATIPAWATIFTGSPPADHGIVGNEFFDRRTTRFAAPVPGSFSDIEPVLRTYTDSQADRLLEVPTVYHRLHALEQDLSIWVSMSPFHGGADKLLAAQRSAVIDVVPALVRALTGEESMVLPEERDQELLDTVVEELDEADRRPDVLTVYVSGTDQYAHGAPGDPDRAIRRFLRGRIDESFARLADGLARHGALEGRYVIVVSDHGHTDVVSDETHALTGEPARVLREAGFRPRPFRLEVAADHPFSAVLAYQGALAYVSLADRSTCPGPKDTCDWARSPRFEEDVLAAAEGFRQANEGGILDAALELILVRNPSGSGTSSSPFSVYASRGRLVPVSDYVTAHPEARWTNLPGRLCDLTVGPFGDRAGDIILFARNATADTPGERRYFNFVPYESGHGSASPRDSGIPLIVAHANRTADHLEGVAREVFAERPAIDRIADLIVALRHGGVIPPEARRTRPARRCDG